MVAYTESKQGPDTSGSTSEGPRSWYRRFFYDHPLYHGVKDPSSMASRDKVKVWCKRCFARRVQEEQLRDVQEGGAVRETKDIELACE